MSLRCRPYAEVLDLAAGQPRTAGDIRCREGAADRRVQRSPGHARAAPRADRIGSSRARSSVPLARRFMAPGRAERRAAGQGDPRRPRRDPAHRSEHRCRARSASAVMVAGGIARAGPLRSRRPVAARLILPVGRAGGAGDPRVRLDRAIGPDELGGAGCAARLSDRASAPARPDTSSTAWRRPRRSRSIVTPSEKPIRTGASSRSVWARHSACSDPSVHRPPHGVYLGGGLDPGPARPAGSVKLAASFTSSASIAPRADACAVPFSPLNSIASASTCASTVGCAGSAEDPENVACTLPAIGRPTRGARSASRRHRHGQLAARHHRGGRQLHRTRGASDSSRSACSMSIASAVIGLPQRHRQIDRRGQQVAARHDTAGRTARQAGGLDLDDRVRPTTCPARPRCR